MADRMESTATAAAEWRSGWALVVACTIGLTMLSVGFSSAGTFFHSLEQEFHWSRSEITSAFIVYAIPGTLLAPPVGVLLDKFGTRAVALPGAVAVGLAVALFSTLNGSLIQWLALWMLLAAATQLIMTSIWQAAISNHFSAGRKLALGIAQMGTGTTTFLAPLLANYLIEHYGWRHAYLILGLGWGRLVALVGYFLLHDHRSRRGRARAAAAAAPVVELTGYNVRDGLRSAAFIKITAAVLICNLLNIALIVHLVELLGWDGLVRDTAVYVASSFGISMLVGNILFGVIGDRIPAKWLCATVVASPAITCALLLYPTESTLQRLLAVMIFGLSCGMQGSAYTYLSTRHFGMKSFGTLRGFTASGLAIATAIAPFIAGVVYDRTGGYAPLLIAGIPLLLVAALLVSTLGPYPKFEPAAAAL
jgi:MFS family permease